MFIWAKIPDKFIDGLEYSDLILEKTGVFLTPGNIFGTNGNKYIRISLCSSEEILNNALAEILKSKMF